MLYCILHRERIKNLRKEFEYNKKTKEFDDWLEEFQQELAGNITFMIERFCW